MTQETDEKIYKSLIKFVVLMALLGFFLLWVTGSLWAAPGYPPPRNTLAALASVTQPLTASGTVLPAVASYSIGDLFIIAADSPIEYRLQMAGAVASWVAMSSAGGSGNTVDGAFSNSVSIGTGPFDTTISRIASGVVGLASAANFFPLPSAPDTASPGTVYFDIPSNHLMLLKSGTWHSIKDDTD